MALQDQEAYDLFTTALEGGINYWVSWVARYKKWLPGQVPDLEGFNAEVFLIESDEEDDNEEDFRTVKYKIDREVILKGLTRIASWDSAGREDLVRIAQAMLSTRSLGEEIDYDASFADVVVQVGLFDEVRYG